MVGREIVVLSPTGCLGLGPMSEEAFYRGLERNPSGIGMDAGSLDLGPHYLGAGIPHQARFQTKRDLQVMLPEAVRRGIPMLIGTAGGSGGEPHLEWNLRILEEVAAQNKLVFRLGIIRSTVDKGYLRKRAASERILGHQHDKDLTPQDVDACTEIVAQLGVEAFLKAIDMGAQVVLAGRACDDAMVATIPIREGFDKGLVLHMGKLVECGALVAEPSNGYSTIIATIRDDHFLLEPGDPAMRCTITSIAAHEIYERTDPCRQTVPGGVVDMTEARFEQISPRVVRISGSKWVSDPVYKLKLEGAEKIGYRAICIGGIRDPMMIRSIDKILSEARDATERALSKSEGLTLGRDFHLVFRLYGRDGSMGPREPQKTSTAHELGLLVEVVASEQRLAKSICEYVVSGKITFANYEGKVATAGNIATPFSPKIMEVGEVYRLRVHHLLPVKNPLDTVRFELREVIYG